MGRARTIARRTFLIGSVAIAGGVAFGAWRILRPIPNPLTDDLAEGQAAITPFVRITSQGVTLIVPRADVGQGIQSAQAHLIAEELDIDPDTCTLDPGQPHEAYYNGTVAADGLPVPSYDHGRIPEALRAVLRTGARLASSQFTGGSTSVADLHLRLREAGAVARETLKHAASNVSGIPVPDLDTRDGAVILPGGDTIPYPDLAEEAARIEPVAAARLRTVAEWRVLGRDFARTDIPAKSTGRHSYGIDMELPGLLHATVRSNPGRGGGRGEYDAAAALDMRGVQAVVPVTDGIGVIADNTWRAFRAAQALDVTWPAPDYPASSEEMWQALDDAHDEDHRDSRLRDDGDIDTAMDSGAQVTAEYRVPYLAHAPLEPLSATVLIEDDHLTIWTATQIPGLLRDRAADLTGLPAEAVTLNVLMAGGSFGRRLDMDFAVQAIEIAMTRPGTPIKTTWSREADMAQDYPRPMHLARGRGQVADGHVTALDLDLISPSLISSWMGRILFPVPGPDITIVWGAFDQPYAIPDYRVTGYRARDLVPIGSWRSPGACSNAFFHESLLSELIHTAGADPLQERLRLVHDDTSRGVLEAVGEMANWAGAQIGEGRGRGLAFAISHGVPVAEVVDVTMTEDGIRIDDVWIAADCGTVFDPQNARAQLTGGAIWGLGHAMNCELTYRDHAPEQTNYHAYQGMRMYQTPRMHTRLVARAAEVRGLGEPATPPAAPALADAIFAATGQRPREMPFNRSVRFV